MVVQGVLNAKAIRLIDASKEEKLEFWNSLNEEQKKRVSSHLDTYKSIARRRYGTS